MERQGIIREGMYVSIVCVRTRTIQNDEKDEKDDNHIPGAAGGAYPGTVVDGEGPDDI